MRALAALLAVLFVPLRGAWAAAPKTPVVALPYALFPGAPDAGGRLAELLAQELRGREELKLVELKPVARTEKPSDPIAQAQAALGKAADLARKSRHAAAADALQSAISLLGAKPSALDETAEKLLADAALQLAVERLASGDEDGGDAALAQLVRLSPDRELKAADYPPAFLVELQGVRKRLFSSPRGSLRVLAPPGAGPEARVLVDGRAVHDAPVLVKDLIPGEHFVRVERAGAAWGEKIIAIAGVETRVAPQPGVEGPSAELTGMLLQGELDRAAVMAAGRLARSAGAQAAVFGAVVKSSSGISLRSFLCLAKGDRVVALPALDLDNELLDGMVQMVKLGDAVVAALASAPAEPILPLSLLPVAEPELAPLVAVAPPKPIPEPPSRALVIPRAPTPEEPEPAPVRKAVQLQPAAQPRIQALEPESIRTVREEPQRKNHAVLWIITGVLVAGASAVGGYYIWEGSQTATTANIDAKWPH